MRLNVAIVVGILAAALVGPAVAQPAAPAAAQPDAQQRRYKIKQRIRAIRAYTLTEQLSLDEATAAKLFPALAKYDEEFDRLHAARAVLQKRLADAGALNDAKAVDALIDEATANQRAIWDTETQRVAQLRKILTPAQVARILIVLPAIERKIQSGLRKATQVAPPKAGKAGSPRTTGAVSPELEPFDTPRRVRRERRSETELVDPFEEEQPSGSKRPPRTAEPCDPFSSSHGCRK